MISFHNVSFSYEKEEPVLNGLDVEFSPGLTLLLGPNGCGKSTLMKLAAGVEKPDSGNITIDGHDLWRAEVEARKNLAYLPEQPDLTPYASLNEILNLVSRLRDEPIEKGKEALRFFDLHEISRRLKSGALVIVVSHFIEPFVKLASHLVTIKNGQAVHRKELPQDLDKRLALVEDYSRGKILS